jgi:hypothetical protein
MDLLLRLPGELGEWLEVILICALLTLVLGGAALAFM